MPSRHEPQKEGAAREKAGNKTGAVRGKQRTQLHSRWRVINKDAEQIGCQGPLKQGTSISSVHVGVGVVVCVGMYVCVCVCREAGGVLGGLSH